MSAAVKDVHAPLQPSVMNAGLPPFLISEMLDRIIAHPHPKQILMLQIVELLSTSSSPENTLLSFMAESLLIPVFADQSPEPTSRQAELQTFRAPSTEEEQREVAENLQMLIDCFCIEGWFNLEQPFKRSGTTLLECARRTKNKFAVEVIEKYLKTNKEKIQYIEKLKDMKNDSKTNLDFNRHLKIEVKLRQDRIHSLHSKLRDCLVEVKELADKIPGLSNALVAKTQRHLNTLPQKDRSAACDNLSNRIQEFLKVTLDYEAHCSNSFHSFLEVYLKQKPDRIREIIPGLNHYLNTIAYREKEYLRLRSEKPELPTLIKKQIKIIAKKIRPIRDVLKKILNILQENDPEYSALCVTHLTLGEKFQTSSPVRMLVENSFDLARINSDYQKQVNETIKTLINEMIGRIIALFNLPAGEWSEPLATVIPRIIHSAVTKMFTDRDFENNKGNFIGFSTICESLFLVEFMVKHFEKYCLMHLDKTSGKSPGEAIAQLCMGFASMKQGETQPQELALLNERRIKKALQQQQRIADARRAAERQKTADLDRKQHAAQLEIKNQNELYTQKLLSELQNLNNGERALLLAILQNPGGMHGRIPDGDFVRLIGKLPYFHTKPTDLGFALYFNEERLTTAHRDHASKKSGVDGNVLQNFVNKIEAIQARNLMIAQLQLEKPKPNSTFNSSSNTRG